jgi:hypothetical protein
VDQAQSRASRLVNGGTAPLRGRVDFRRISNIFYNPGFDKRTARGDETGGLTVIRAWGEW